MLLLWLHWTIASKVEPHKYPEGVPGFNSKYGSSRSCAAVTHWAGDSPELKKT